MASNKEVQRKIEHMKMLKAMNRHSMVADVAIAIRNMINGDFSDGVADYYKGWTKKDFQTLLKEIEK